MNKTLKEIGHVLFSIFVMPFIFLIVFAFPSVLLLKKVDESDPYEAVWEMPYIELKEDYDAVELDRR